MLRKMIAATPVALLLVTGPAMACDFCEKAVTLTQPLAQCYLDRYQAEIERMDQSGSPAQLINLTVCDGVTSANRGGSLPGPDAAEQPVSTSFLLDKEGLVCLAVALRAASWPGNGTAALTIEVPRGCQAQ